MIRVTSHPDRKCEPPTVTDPCALVALHAPRQDPLAPLVANFLDAGGGVRAVTGPARYRARGLRMTCPRRAGKLRPSWGRPRRSLTPRSDVACSDVAWQTGRVSRRSWCGRGVRPAALRSVASSSLASRRPTVPGRLVGVPDRFSVTATRRTTASWDGRRCTRGSRSSSAAPATTSGFSARFSALWSLVRPLSPQTRGRRRSI